MISQLISRLMILIFGTLYPAYRSYKAVKTKDVREYVKWMMYWIVFAFFTTLENAADLFISWVPLYYEVKIGFLIWLLSPATKGSSILYRKFVHPWLARHEQDIDKYIESARQSSYATLLRVGRQGISVATETFLKTAVTGQNTLFNTLRKYGSMQDLHQPGPLDEFDGGQGMPPRVAWNGNPQINEPNDQMQYNFENDYRILEQQYHHDDVPEGYSTLPGGANLARSSSTQNIILESQDESDQGTAEEPILIDDALPRGSNEPATSGRRRTASNSSTAASNNRRPVARSSSSDVSQMRGYSTLPRSRKTKVNPASQPVLGGTLPRSSRRSKTKLTAKSQEV